MMGKMVRGCGDHVHTLTPDGGTRCHQRTPGPCPWFAPQPALEAERDAVFEAAVLCGQIERWRRTGVMGS